MVGVLRGVLAGALLVGLVAAARAETISIAVAANFSAAAEDLATAFSAMTGDQVALSAGATGGLYTQISQGAPFEVFLAADDERPARAVAEGFGVEGTVFTYAVGRLVLFSPSLDLSAGDAVLKGGGFQYIAIADPASAPYGAAAVATMETLGMWPDLQPKLVTGESVTQTLQFIESGNAELGFVALSQVIGRSDGSRWVVPAEMYAPIVQDAVLLKVGEGSAGARAFLDFLKSDEGRAIIASYGYATAGMPSPSQ